MKRILNEEVSKMKKKEYIATFQVKFNPEDMCDETTLHLDFGGSWERMKRSSVELPYWLRSSLTQ
jgi:hypothetical protein